MPEWVAIPFSRGFSRPRNRTRVSYSLQHWQVGSLPLAPPEKPVLQLQQENNTPRWNCFSFKGNYSESGSNLGLLRCRQILYHLIYQRSPHIMLYYLMLLMRNWIPFHFYAHDVFRIFCLFWGLKFRKGVSGYFFFFLTWAFCLWNIIFTMCYIKAT